MPTSTTNYGLIKPGTDDPILIGQINDNMDAIDAALKGNADAIENKPDAADIPTPSTAAPAMDGTAAAGTSTDYARADHVHPSDTSKQDALTAAQLAAVNSGIDSAKVEQIETNKNNIITAYGGIPNKNKFNIYNLSNISNLTVNDGVCTQVTNDTRANLMFGVWKGSATVVSPKTITTNGMYHYSFTKSVGDTTIRFGHNGETRSSQVTYDISDFYNGTYVLQLNVINCVQANGKYSWNQVIICSQADYAADPTYQPYAMSNAELTAAIQALQAQLAKQ